MKKMLVLAAALVLVAGIATAAKVDVCHIRGDGNYHLTSVGERAKDAHLRHGDGLPGDVVPGFGSFVGDSTMTDTGFGQVNLDFEGGGASFGPDCGIGPATGSVSWDRVTGSIESWSGPIIDVAFLGDGETVEFTVRPDSAPVGPDVIGCDITFRVTEGGPNVGTWENIALVDSPGGTCIAAGQTQGPWFIYAGGITVEDPMF